MKKLLFLTIAITATALVAPVQNFTLVLNFYEVASPLTREGITLGMNEYASAGFDPEFDLFLPPPVGVGYFFSVDTVSPFNKLSADFRNTSAFGSIWLIDKSNTSFGANVLWEDTCAIFSEDSATIFYKVISVFDPIPARPFFDSTWSTMFTIDTINYNPTLQRLLFSVDFYTPTAIGETIPLDFRINPPRPNPFNSEVSILIENSAGCPLELQIFDLRGSLVREISAESGGFVWDGRDSQDLQAPSGAYLMRVSDHNGHLADFRAILLK